MGKGNTDMTKITVIMPSLNVAPYIEECISSVENQTLTDIEILCIDAGSTDGTLAILQSHAENDSRIRIINSSAKSYGYQVNLGIREACGEYIDIVETDDYISDRMLEILYEAVSKYSADYVKSSFNRISHIGNRKVYIKHTLLPTDIGIYNDMEVTPQEYPKLHTYDSSIWAGMFCRNFLLDNNITLNESKGAAFQDIGFAHEVLSAANKAVYLDEPMYQYRMDRDDASTWNRNCLVYAAQEYRRIFEDNAIQAERFEIHRNAIDTQMANSFICEMNKVLQMSGYILDIKNISEPYRWLHDRFIKEITTGNFDFCDIDNNMAVKLKLLLETPCSYVDLVKAEDELTQAKRKKSMQYIVGKNIVIFGCGQRCSSLINLLFGNADVNIDTLTDNDETKWNTSLYGLSVVSPVKALADYADDYYVIANKAHGADIKKQLISMGVKEDRIIVWVP